MQTNTKPAIDIAAVVRACRLRIAEQYYAGCKRSQDGGDGQALVAIACASVVFEAHIQAGGLVPSALSKLREVADNLGTTRRCGADVVETCIAAGQMLFAELEAVYADREEMRGAA